MSDIFISYSSKDRDKAKDIAAAIEQQGFSVWWDRSIPPGKTFAIVIEEALDAANCVIVLWSNTSVSSKWVKIEASEGDRRGILIPVLIDDAKIPFEFRQIQAADLRDWEGKLHHPGFDNLLKAAASILGRPVQPSQKTNEVRFKLENTIIDGGTISVNLSQIATEHVVFREGVNTTLSCIVINI